MKFFIFIVVAFLTISYPFFVYWGLNNFDISIIAIGGIIVTITQFSLRSLEAKKNFKTFLPLTIALVATYIAAYLLKSSAYMKFTPVLISANLLILFVSSLIKPPSMVERFAKIRYKDLPPEATPYCRNVTIIWVLFFIGNGSVAFWTVFQDIKIWTFYNGFLAYILMGTIFGGEFLYRTIFIKKKSSLLKASNDIKLMNFLMYRKPPACGICDYFNSVITAIKSQAGCLYCFNIFRLLRHYLKTNSVN